MNLSSSSEQVRIKSPGELSQAGEILISIRGLSKRFGGKTPVTALKDINLDIKKGEFISIVGPSGCGKTTLLRIIAGLEEKTAGEIIFTDGTAEDIGFVFQDPNLMPWRTALQNAALVLELRGVEEEERLKRAREVLRLSGLAGYEDFYPKDLSGGMRHRVAIARSLVYDPPVLVMDEPFAALDILTRSELSLELRKIWRETGKTIIYVTHDLREAIFLSERVAIMTPQPGSIKEIVEVNLPEERNEETKDTEEFMKLQAKVRKAIHTRKHLEGRVEEPGEDTREAKRPVKKDYLNLENLKLWGQYAAVFIFFLALWKGFVWVFNIPKYLVPAPEDVFWEYIALAGGTLWMHTWFTLKETILGFLAGAALGFGIGYLLGKSKTLEQILMPYVVAAQTAPKIVFAPLFVIWFGFGITSKAILVMLVVFFPILINTILGLESIDRDKKELMKSTRATWFQTFAKLEIPAIMPELFAGFKTGITLAVIGAVVGEFVGAKGGLGYLAMFASGISDMPKVFAAIIQLILLGIVLYGIVVLLERILMPWRAEG